MLTDLIVEEDFERDEECWYGRQDLEHDLHLAAQLGKTLLDRNRELEQALQQMCATNGEQIQEIEYLGKQVELLRQMNEQHAKVYEQLDLVARDLEHGNQRLATENRLAQHRISSLTDTVDELQGHMEELQAQLEQLQVERARGPQDDQRRTLGAQSVPCLKELYDLHQDRSGGYGYDGWHAGWTRSPVSPLASPWRRDSAAERDPAVERAALQRSVQTLQGQMVAERCRREAAERETEATAGEKGAMEERLAQLEGCRARQLELEAEVDEIRRLWRSECASSARLLPDTVFISMGEEQPCQGGSDDGEAQPEGERAREKEKGGEEEERELQRGGRGRLRCSSDSFLSSALAEELRRRHDQTCVRRAQAMKQRGVSLLNEVDAQYSALQVKYEELLQRCQNGGPAGGLSHKAVQTPQGGGPGACQPPPDSPPSRQGGARDNGPPAEYKVLFAEIFSRIQKTKEDLSENHRRGPPATHPLF